MPSVSWFALAVTKRELAELADHKPLGRARIEIGGNPRGPVGWRIEIIGIGEVADPDVRMVDHPVQVNHAGVFGSVRKDERVTLACVKEADWHGNVLCLAFCRVQRADITISASIGSGASIRGPGLAEKEKARRLPRAPRSSS